VKARRSEGPKERLQSDQEACRRETSPKRQQPEVGNHVTLREPEPPWWCSHPKRQGERHSGKTCGTREEDSDAGDNDDSLHHPTSRVNPRSSPIAGCGKPHVRWCGSPGGRNIPSGRPDQLLPKTGAASLPTANLRALAQVLPPIV